MTIDSDQPPSSESLNTLGWKEWVALPELGIDRIKVKVDTGARTSALHAFFVEPYEQSGQRWLRFGIHPIQGDFNTQIVCDAPLFDERKVTDSGGHAELRPVIETTVIIGSKKVVAQITLTNRDTMKFRMLLGRTCLNGNFTVNPEAAYLAGKPLSLPTID